MAVKNGENTLLNAHFSIHPCKLMLECQNILDFTTARDDELAVVVTTRTLKSAEFQ